MTILLSRFVFEEDGQDLAEYALAGLFIGLAGLLVWAAVEDAFALHYAARDAAEQNLWQPPNP